MGSDDDWDDMDSCWCCPKCDTWHDFADEGCTCERDEQLREEGAAAERARIVAWLREEQSYDDEGVIEAIADAIEAGEHMPEQEAERRIDAAADRTMLEAAETERDALAAELAANRPKRQRGSLRRMEDPMTDPGGWVVELHPGCWLAPWRGDPGRTLVRGSARVYATERGARVALGMARRFRLYRGAAVRADDDDR